MRFKSTKTYGHDIGLSAAFRQWRAESHCKYVHGYALAVHLEFEADILDERNWVVDFGSLKSVKNWLQYMFDHKLLVARDDPELDYFIDGDSRGVLDIVIVDGTGCETFARLIYDYVNQWIQATKQDHRVRLNKVEVKEHGANSAIVERRQQAGWSKEST